MNAVAWVGAVLLGLALAAVPIAWMWRRKRSQQEAIPRPAAIDRSAGPGRRQTAVFEPELPKLSSSVGATRVGNTDSIDTAAHRVVASALVPRSVARGEVCRIEAVLARRGVISRELARLAADSDDLLWAQRRELTMPLEGQTLLELTLECAQADLITPRLQRLRWTGATLTTAFQLRPAANLVGHKLYADVNVFVDRVCIGHLPLSIPVADTRATSEAERTPTPTSFEVPRHVFMSYTHADRLHVLPIARAMKAIGVNAFMDRLSLEGGEDWESRLFAEIDACDCFMLFWSEDSAVSDWVQRETLRALERQRQTPQRRPKIVTHLLCKPPPPVPPAALSSLHFNDPGYALWESALAAGNA